MQAFEQRTMLLPEFVTAQAALAAQAQAQPAQGPAPAPPVPGFVLYYTIRFDQKGYRINNLAELLRHFNEASAVERLVFELHTTESINTNNRVGSTLSLRLDEDDKTPYYLLSSADDEHWMTGSFVAVKEVLNRHRNKYGWIRNPWANVVLQLLGLLIGFATSLWVASRVAPFLRIENAFLITFVIVLLVFGNLWGPVGQGAQNFVKKVFPNVKFYRPHRDKLDWLVQGLVISLLGAAMLYGLGWVFSYIGSVLGVFVANP